MLGELSLWAGDLSEWGRLLSLLSPRVRQLAVSPNFPRPPSSLIEEGVEGKGTAAGLKKERKRVPISNN